jgi:hypothetical protein
VRSSILRLRAEEDRRKKIPRCAALRGCDFFDFLQKAVLKIKHLHAKKSGFFKKVTPSQDDRYRRWLKNETESPGKLDSSITYEMAY